MRSSLSGLVDNLSEIKDNKCLDKKLINELVRKFSNTYSFCNGDINKFIMFLKKVVTLINIWIVGINVMKQSYHLKKIFILNQI